MNEVSNDLSVHQEFPENTIMGEESVVNNNDLKTTVAQIKDCCDAFEGIPDDVTVVVQSGSSFDLRSVRIKKHVPATKNFRIFSFKNPKSKR